MKNILSIAVTGIIMLLLASSLELDYIETELINGVSHTSGKVTNSVSIGQQYGVSLTMENGNSIWVATPYYYPKGKNLTIPLSEHIIIEINGYGVRFFQQIGKELEPKQPMGDPRFQNI